MSIDLYPDIVPAEYYQSDKWKPIHRQVIGLHVAGLTNNEIAAELGKTPAWVSKILNDPRAQLDKDEMLERLTDRLESVEEKLAVTAHMAFDTAKDVMQNATKQDVRLRAAFGLLDRAGFSPIRREVSLQAQLPADDEFLQRLSATLTARPARVERTKYEVMPAEIVSDTDTADAAEETDESG